MRKGIWKKVLFKHLLNKKYIYIYIYKIEVTVFPIFNNAKEGQDLTSRHTVFYCPFLLLPLLPIQYKLSIQGNSPAKKHASKAQKVFSSKWLLSLLKQLVVCFTTWRFLIACKCEDPAPPRPVSHFRAFLPHKVLLQDFRMELEASFKFPWPYLYPDCCIAQKQTLCPRHLQLVYSPAIFHGITGGRNSCYQGQ